jgi:hypothetical protein
MIIKGKTVVRMKAEMHLYLTLNLLALSKLKL